MKASIVDLKDFLDEQVERYNSVFFIENDPVYIPHQFSKKEDIEISAFFIAVLAWGNRKAIIKSGMKLMQLMDLAPYDFIKNAEKRDLKPFEKFVHRTFNGTDCIHFILLLQQLYKNHGGLEKVFTSGVHSINQHHINFEFPFQHPLALSISNFKRTFFESKPHIRSAKHISDPLRNSSAKRICMFLRWMVRNDKSGVDFGLWKKINSSALCCPLDVHSGRIARELGLLQRKQNDWKAVIELTANLALLNADDPVIYDYALFGIGVNNKLKL